MPERAVATQSRRRAGRAFSQRIHGIVRAAMHELRELRHATGLGQREFAALLSIPLETFRPWDMGDE